MNYFLTCLNLPLPFLGIFLTTGCFLMTVGHLMDEDWFLKLFKAVSTEKNQKLESNRKIERNTHNKIIYLELKFCFYSHFLQLEPRELRFYTLLMHALYNNSV